MRWTVSIELFFAWILLGFCHISKGKGYYQLWKGNTFRSNNSSKYVLSPISLGRGRTVMTCDCSWGTVPRGFNISERKLQTKIVGGTKVQFDKKENYPMMAALQVDGCHICGASILTEFHALTAAHCFEGGPDLTKMILAVGIRYRCREPNDGGQYVPLLNPAYIHEYYDEEENHNDIAIVVTQRKIIFSKNVGPTCIHAKPFKSLDEPVLVLGWGKVFEDGDTSRDLLKVFLKPIDMRICKNDIPAGLIDDNLNLQMCTYAENKDACSGDSGGPLFTVDREINRIVQVALVSMGVGCARVGEPGVNTALYPYLGWMQWTIERSMRKHHPKPSAEALFAWILFFGSGYSVNGQRQVLRPYKQYLLNEKSIKHNMNPSSLHNHHPYLEKKQMDASSMTCNCSWGTVPGKQVLSKIVGGMPVGRKENYPMMVGIQDIIEECMFCAGSILTEYHVLTAAHCLYEENILAMSLAFGVKARCREKGDGGQYIKLLKTIYIHEYYDPAENHNDIAIVLAERKIIFSHNVGPTCIHTEPFTSSKASILILGWGRIGEDFGPSKVLLEVFVKRIDTKTCQNQLPAGFINDNLNLQLCTYAVNKDACGGDSGGPLFTVDTSLNRLTQIALVSMGEGCARKNIPAVNTALYPYLGWIQWTIAKSKRKHFPKSYSNCDNSFCYITAPEVG